MKPFLYLVNYTDPKTGKKHSRKYKTTAGYMKGSKKKYDMGFQYITHRFFEFFDWMKK